MKALQRRVQRLEERVLRLSPVRVRLLWHDEVGPCALHEGCLVLTASKSHEFGVIRLSFAEDLYSLEHQP